MAEQGPAGDAAPGELIDCTAKRTIMAIIPRIKPVHLACDLPTLHAGDHHDPEHGHWCGEYSKSERYL